jgi:hypothetical protein
VGKSLIRTKQAWDVEDSSLVVAQLLDATIGTPTSRGLRCDLEISQEGDPLLFSASIEWPDLSDRSSFRLVMAAGWIFTVQIKSLRAHHARESRGMNCVQAAGFEKPSRQ